MRVPFGASVRLALYSERAGTFWFVVRRVEAAPSARRPAAAAARLKAYRTVATLAPLELVTIAAVPAGVGVALASVKLDATSSDMAYLEACLRAYVDGAPTPLFLSSGAEDYFLSAYYFNEGGFHSPASGLTYYDGVGTLSAYKVHERDAVVFTDGLELVWRNCEATAGSGNATHCPDRWCGGGDVGRAADADAAAAAAAAAADAAADAAAAAPPVTGGGAATVGRRRVTGGGAATSPAAARRHDDRVRVRVAERTRSPRARPPAARAARACARASTCARARRRRRSARARRAARTAAEDTATPEDVCGGAQSAEAHAPARLHCPCGQNTPDLSGRLSQLALLLSETGR